MKKLFHGDFVNKTKQKAWEFILMSVFLCDMTPLSLYVCVDVFYIKYIY